MRKFIHRNIIIIISLSISVLLIILYNQSNINIFDSKNIQSLFEVTITFVSILLGFLGVLISSVLSLSNDSNIIGHFFKTVNRNNFKNKIMQSVVSGIFLVLNSLILIVSDSISDSVVNILFITWILLLSFFSSTEVSFYSLFIKMIVSSPQVKIQKNNKQHLDLNDIIPKQSEQK